MRLKLIIAYDGRPFRGWQSQAGGNTVQDHIEAAFKTICGVRVAVNGSGRTDAGVHALGQCAHVVVEHHRLLSGDWVAALNANLPREIRILKSMPAGKDFHARFSAKGKIYTYQIWNHPVLSPFQTGRTWHLPDALDLPFMDVCARGLCGRLDFAAFSANRGHHVANTIRTIRRIKIQKKGSLVTLVYEGDGFLYKMVRLMTGSLVRCARHRAGQEWLAELLEGKAKTSHAAPAEGLYLTRVIY